MLVNTCPHCGKDMGPASVCPGCEHRRQTVDGRKPGRSSLWMTVLIIILCFLAAAISYFFRGCSSAREDGRYTVCQTNLKNIGTALDNYAADHKGHYPQKMEELVKTGYLNEIPLCSVDNYLLNKRDTYSASYISSTKTDAYTYFCMGKNHIKSTWIDYPQYNSYQGLITRP